MSAAAAAKVPNWTAAAAAAAGGDPRDGTHSLALRSLVRSFACTHNGSGGSSRHTNNINLASPTVVSIPHLPAAAATTTTTTLLWRALFLAASPNNAVAAAAAHRLLSPLNADDDSNRRRQQHGHSLGSPEHMLLAPNRDPAAFSRQPASVRPNERRYTRGELFRLRGRGSKIGLLSGPGDARTDTRASFESVASATDRRTHNGAAASSLASRPLPRGKPEKSSPHNRYNCASQRPSGALPLRWPLSF